MGCKAWESLTHKVWEGDARHENDLHVKHGNKMQGEETLCMVGE